MERTCVICGGGFTKRAPKQATCGKPECKQERQRQHVRNYNQRQRDMRIAVADPTTPAAKRNAWSQLLSEREQHNPGKWYACPTIGCRRTNKIAPNEQTVKCWRCHGTVKKYDLPKKERDAQHPRTLDT